MSWSKLEKNLEKITWILYMLYGFSIGYSMSAHGEDISLWLALAICFLLGMGYSTYLDIKRMEDDC